MAWVLCIRDEPGGEDGYIGPFFSLGEAQKCKQRCIRQLQRQGEWYDDGGSTDAIIEEVTPGRAWREVVEQ